MLQFFVHTLMIATVLVCPALSARCCDAGNTQPASVVAVEGCGTCCGHGSERSVPSPPAPHDPSSDECHDCFCEGALPVGPYSLDSRAGETRSFDFVVLTPAKTLACLHQASARLDDCQRPPKIGRRLAILCTLLI